MENHVLKDVNNCLNTNIEILKRHLVVKVLIFIEMLFIFNTSVD
jgi:hypothetical protein